MENISDCTVPMVWLSKVQSRLSKVERSEAEPRLLFADLRVL